MSTTTSKPSEQSSIELFKSEIKKMAKDNLLKHLEGREFNIEKIKVWGEMILNDLGNDLKKKYPEFGFGLFFYISDLTNYISNNKSIYYVKTDLTIMEAYNTNHYYSEIRVFANKKYSTKENFNKNMSSKDIMNINKRFHDSLEGRTYNENLVVKYCENIVNDINNILLERANNRPCSFQICFINKLPIKNIYTDFKFIDLEYMPFFFSYSNDSLSSNLFLFVVNN